MNKTTAFPCIETYDWNTTTAAGFSPYCWWCGTEVEEDWIEEEHIFFAYVTLKDWTRIGLCSPTCVHSAFEDRVAPFFDWRPLDSSNTPDREGWDGTCSACGQKRDQPYITLTARDGYGGWHFCSPRCARTFDREGLRPCLRWKIEDIDDEAPYDMYDFLPKPRKTVRRPRR